MWFMIKISSWIHGEELIRKNRWEINIAHLYMVCLFRFGPLFDGFVWFGSFSSHQWDATSFSVTIPDLIVCPSWHSYQSNINPSYWASSLWSAAFATWNWFMKRFRKYCGRKQCVKARVVSQYDCTTSVTKTTQFLSKQRNVKWLGWYFWGHKNIDIQSLLLSCSADNYPCRLCYLCF